MYVYKVTILPTDQYYFGCQYNKNVRPTDLGKSYFTSSTKVQFLLFTHGLGKCKFEILGEYLDKKICRRTEERLIKEHLDDPLLLNDKKGFQADNSKGKIWITNGIQEARVFANSVPLGYIQGRSDEIKNMLGKQGANLHTERAIQARKTNVIDTIWINDGHRTKRLKTSSSIPEGFQRGRLNGGQQ